MKDEIKIVYEQVEVPDAEERIKRALDILFEEG